MTLRKSGYDEIYSDVKIETD